MNQQPIGRVRGIMMFVVGAFLGAQLLQPAVAAVLTKPKVKKIAAKQANAVFDTKIGPALAPEQNACQHGAVFAFAVIDGDELDATFSTNGINAQFNCQGGTIVARSTATGDYEIQIPGLTTPAIGGDDDFSLVGTVADDDNVVLSFQSTSGDDFVEVDIWDNANAPIDEEFSIVAFNDPS